MADKVCVGAIAGAFGVRGDVRLKSFCATPEDVATYGALTTDAGTSYEITLNGPVKGGFAARLSGVRTRDEAEALRGTRLYAPRAALPNLPDDEFYHTDLIGLEVVDTGGVLLGKVKAVLNHGATDLLELRLPGRSDTALLPFTRDNVPTVDLTAGRIVADPPAGLLPEDEA